MTSETAAFHLRIGADLDDPAIAPHVARTWVFGTEPGCDVRITRDPTVSPRHYRVILLRDGRAFVEDLGSANGTTVVDGVGRLSRLTPFGQFRDPANARAEITRGGFILTGRTRISWKK